MFTGAHRVGLGVVGGAVLLCGATAFAHHQQQALMVENGPFRVVGTSFPWVIGKASWIGEDTIVFAGFPGDQTWENGHPPPRRAYVWRIGGQIEQLSTDADKVRHACVNDGHPAYTSERGKQSYLTTVVGETRTEVPLPPYMVGDGQQANFAGPTLCQPHMDVRVKDRRWVPNWSGSRYLDFGSRALDIDVTRRDDITFETSTGEQRRSLSVIDTPVSYVHAQTPEWDDSFVLWDAWAMGSERREAMRTVPVYRVSPDGSVNITHLANGRPLWSSSFIAYRDGYLVATMGDGDPREAGLFLLEETKIERVLKGYMSDPTVSPSGCRLAVSDPMGPDGKDYFMQRLKIIDLCGPPARKP